MSERKTLPQDSAQYEQSTNPQKEREEKERIAKLNKEAQEKYEKELALFNKQQAEYETALKAYEQEVARQEAAKKAEADKVAAEKAKIEADQKRLDDINAKHQAAINELIQQKEQAIQNVSRYTTRRKVTGSGGGFPQGDGTDIVTWEQVLKDRAQLQVDQNAVARQWNVVIESKKREQSVEYQKAAFSINYPDAGALGGTWFRDWQKNPHGTRSLSTRYEQELQRRTTQAQRAREVSIKNAQANALKAAQNYSVDAGAFTKTITNFGGEGIREFSQAELKRREKIKPLPPKPIAVTGKKGLTVSQNRAPYTGVKFETITKPKSIQEKQEYALADFYNQYKSTTQPTAPILEGVVQEQTGVKPTLQTQKMITDLTKKPQTFEFERTATYTNPNTGRSFNAKTGIGDMGIAATLGFRDDQNMQEPQVNTSDVQYVLLNTQGEGRKPMSLVDRGIEGSLKELDKAQTAEFNINDPKTWQPTQFMIGLGKGSLATVASIKNLWTEKVETLNFRGEPKSDLLLQEKIQYTNPQTGVYSGYAFLESVGKVALERITNKSPIKFDEPKKESIRIPKTLFGEAMSGDFQNVGKYVEEKGVYGSAGEAAEIFAGGALAKPSKLAKVLKTKELESLGELPSKQTMKNLYKPESISSSVLVKKSPIQVVKDFVTRKQAIPKWQLDDIVKRKEDWLKLSPQKKHEKLLGQAQQQAEAQHRLKLKYDWRYQQKYAPRTILVAPTFTKTATPLGVSLAGIIARQEATKPKPPKPLDFRPDEYKPSTRANEIDLTDSAVHKPTHTYTKPKEPESISKYAPKPQPKSNMPRSPTDLFKTQPRKPDTPSDYKEIKTSSGVLLQKVETKQITKQVTKQSTKQISKQAVKPKLKTKQIQKQKVLPKTKQKYGLLSSQLSKQAVKPVQAYKQKTRQKTDVMYKQKQKQLYKQAIQTKQIYAQPQMYKQTTKQKLKAPLRLKQPLKVKSKTPLRLPPLIYKQVPAKPPRDPPTTRKVPTVLPEFDKKEKRIKNKNKRQKQFIGNVSEVKVEGVYDRAETIYGKKKVKKLSEKDFKKYAPKYKKSKKKVRII